MCPPGQATRERALAAFRSGEMKVLVATDIAARGIDIEALGHVVNFDVPKVPEDYIHRVGRTARAEAVGDAFTFVAPEEEPEEPLELLGPEELRGGLEALLFVMDNPVDEETLAAALRCLASDYQCNDVMLEAGPTLSGAMLQAGLIDEIVIYIGARLLGSDALPLFKLPGLRYMKDHIGLEIVDLQAIAGDCRITARVVLK